MAAGLSAEAPGKLAVYLRQGPIEFTIYVLIVVVILPVGLFIRLIDGQSLPHGIRRFPLAWFRPFPVQELRNLLKVGLPSAGEQLSYSSSQVVITFFINMCVEYISSRNRAKNR